MLILIMTTTNWGCHDLMLTMDSDFDHDSLKFELSWFQKVTDSDLNDDIPELGLSKYSIDCRHWLQSWQPQVGVVMI